MRWESASFLPAARYGTNEHRDNVIAQQLQLAGLCYKVYPQLHISTLKECMIMGRLWGGVLNVALEFLVVSSTVLFVI